jgi:hypothetical protein
MSNYSTYNTSRTNGSNALQPTENQLNQYYTQCARKNVSPIDVSALTRGQMSEELQRIFDLPLPASEAQLQALKVLLEELTNAGVPGVKMPSEAFFAKLNTQSASSWIEKTRQLRAQHMDIMPASDQQIERLVEMYVFPDMNWESVSKQTTRIEEVYDVPDDGGESRLSTRSITYTEETSIRTRINVEGEVNGKQLWRFLTPDEFRMELKAKLTHQQASRLIDEHQGAFEAWKRTRLTRGQYNQIRNIENRLANIYKPRVVTETSSDTPFDFDAEDAPFNVSSTKQQWNPSAYEPLAEQIIGLFSREEADDYIRQLTYELNNPELRSFSGAQDLDYADYSIEEARTAKNGTQAKTNEFKELNNFLFALSDITGNYFEAEGHNVESLRHEALQVFFTYASPKGGENGASNEKREAVRTQIKDFVKQAILSKSIKFDALIRLADRSEIATEIVDDMIAKLASL